jgi:hypothetical protein
MLILKFILKKVFKIFDLGYMEAWIWFVREAKKECSVQIDLVIKIIIHQLLEAWCLVSSPEQPHQVT